MRLFWNGWSRWVGDEGVAECCFEVGEADGFGQESVHTRGEGLGSLGGAGSGGEGDDGKSPAAAKGPDAARGFVAIHFGHLAVHEDGGIVVGLED